MSTKKTTNQLYSYTSRCSILLFHSKQHLVGANCHIIFIIKANKQVESTGVPRPTQTSKYSLKLCKYVYELHCTCF